MKRSRLLELGLITLVVALAIHRIYDPDFWLHLAAGRWSLVRQAIPRSNTFSFTYPDYPWLDVYWLYQIVVASIWQWFDAAGVVALRVALCLALFGLVLVASRTKLTNGAAACVVVGWLLLAPRLTDRPELVSYVLLAGMLVAITRQQWWWCLPIQIVWANVQGLFLLGPLLVALAGIAAWWRGQRETATRAGLVAVLLVGCCAVSPFGIANVTLFRDFFRTLQSSEMQVEELVSPFHPLVRAVDGTGWLLIVYAILVAVVFVRKARQVEGCYWLWSAVSLPMALMVRRAIPVFVLCSLPGLIAMAPKLESKFIRTIIVCLCILLAAGLRIKGQTQGGSLNLARFPASAVEHLQAELSEEPRVWNTDFSTGGYLIAQNISPAIDGRLEAYPEDFLRAYFRSATDAALRDSLLAEFGVTHVLVSSAGADSDRWLSQMRAATGWALVHEDPTASLFRRTP